MNIIERGTSIAIISLNARRCGPFASLLAYKLVAILVAILSAIFYYIQIRKRASLFG